jgi:hypothetical protein
MQMWTRLILVLVFWVPIVCTTHAQTTTSKSDKSQRIDTLVMPGTAEIAGVSISEWGNRYWQWLLRAPIDHDPGLDTTGNECHWDQGGPVWFLAGSYGSDPVIRRCRVPGGKYFLLPIAADLVIARPLDDQLTCQAQLEDVRRGADAILRPYLSFDGEAVNVLNRHRVSSKECFDAAGRGRKLSASDGYFVLLRPLPLGKYVLKFGNQESGPARREIQVLLEVVNPKEALPQLSWRPSNFAPAQDQLLSIELRPQPLMGATEIARRFAALAAADRRYAIVTSPRRYEGQPITISVAPACLKELEAVFPDLAPSLEYPFDLLVIQRDGKVRVELMRLGLKESESRILRRKINHDLNRFLLEALDKRIRVHDEDVVFANEQRILNKWKYVTAHREGRVRPQDLHDTDAWCLDAKAPNARVFYESVFGAARKSTVEFMRPGATITNLLLSNDALTVSSSYTHGIAKANRTYSEGQLYAEFEFGSAGVTGKNRQTLTNIAVEGATGSTGPDPDSDIVNTTTVQIRHGDVIGLALDLDQRKVRYHINGAWMPPRQPMTDDRSPGSLQGEGPYSIFVRMQGGMRNERETWTANFGASKFAYPVPKGYTPYNAGPPRYSFDSGGIAR